MFTGSAPPSSMRPSLDERAAFAALAEAGLLELLQHLEGEAVVDLREVDVRGRTPAIANASGAAMREPDPEDVIAVRDLVGGVRLPGAPRP